MKKKETEVTRVQRVIDKYRDRGVDIKVKHYECSSDPDLDETYISIPFHSNACAYVIAEEIQNELSMPADTGGGLGARDLELNRLLIGIK